MNNKTDDTGLGGAGEDLGEEGVSDVRLAPRLRATRARMHGPRGRAHAHRLGFDLTGARGARRYTHSRAGQSSALAIVEGAEE